MNRSTIMEKAMAATAVCKHCGNQLETATSAFCCAGCRAVYALLQDQGLTDFYRYADSSGSSIEKPERVSGFEELDDPNFQASYCTKPSSMKFFVSGLDCTACVWLVDQIPGHSNCIDSIKTDFFNSTLEVTIKSGARFSHAARTLQEFGLNARPVRAPSETKSLAEKEERANLTRIAVAAVGAGNIMLLSISIYAGVEGALKDVFNWLMFILALPVLTYSALPFYRNTVRALKLGKIHLDFPISLAIWAGTLVSVHGLVTGRADLYFDSLSMLVFLLLSSRHWLKSIQGRYVGRLPLADYLFGGRARIENGELISSLSLNRGDRFILRAAEKVPTDATVIAGWGWIDNSMLTGESRAQKIGPGDSLYAGTYLLEGEVTAVTDKTVADSRVTKLLEAIDSDLISKNALNSSAERLARKFLIGTLSIGAALIFYFGVSGMLETGIYRALAVMIVACPCVFAMAIPWTYSLAVRKASNDGILVKNSEIFERLVNAEEIAFDKTGTLTQGFLEVSDFHVYIPYPSLEMIAFELEAASAHPVAKSIRRFLQNIRSDAIVSMPRLLTDVRELPQGGVSGRDGESLWTITPRAGQEELSIGLYKDTDLMAAFSLRDTLRADAKSVIEKIQTKFSSVAILSGDQREVTEQTARELGINDAYSAQTPESKLLFVQTHPKCAMVGDGGNDAPALKASYCSIAMHGSLESSLKAADVYLTRPGLQPILALIELSEKTVRVVRHNLAFTAFYNVIGVSLAITGHVNALWAAVLMPLSSLTVTVHSLYRMRNTK